ncbi:MAG: hypothetical protein ABI488_15690 [Polyangiaceae bacterium]
MGPESFIADMLSLPRISGAGMLLALATLGGASSCLYHSSDRCDPGQVYNADAGACVCDESLNKVTGDLGCEACDANATAKDDVCTCNDGFSGDGMTCVAVGADCTADADCKDKLYNTCHLVSANSGYCTNSGCTTVDDPACSAGYKCDLSGKTGYCERPPSGAGNACAKDSDCKGTDATYCENHQSNQCFVEGCSLTANDCFPGKECCDLTGPSFGIIKKQICVDAGTCAQ